MSITLFYQCDRCNTSMIEPFATLIVGDTPHIHLCEKCLATVEDWINGKIEISKEDEE